MTIVLLIFLLIALVFFVGSILLYVQFKKQVQQLFLHAENISHKKFSYKQIENLPEPVQRYFKHVLKNDQSYISYVSLTHDGTFKTSQKGKWMAIKGEQFFTTHAPGFIWKGTTAMFTARDMYIGNRGKLTVLLFNVFKVADVVGNKVNEGELQRWLSESVWFPTNLLPSHHVQWLPIYANSATLSYHFKDISFNYKVHFNTLGEIITMQTQRFFGDTKRETWLVHLADYQMLNDVIIPTQATVSWQLATGNFEYAKFRVINISYDKPLKV